MNVIGRQRHVRSSFTCRSGTLDPEESASLVSDWLDRDAFAQVPVPFHPGHSIGAKGGRVRKLLNGIGCRAWNVSARALLIGRFPHVRPLIDERYPSGTAPFGWGLAVSASLFSFGSRRPQRKQRSLRDGGGRGRGRLAAPALPLLARAPPGPRARLGRSGGLGQPEPGGTAAEALPRRSRSALGPQRHHASG